MKILIIGIILFTLVSPAVAGVSTYALVDETEVQVIVTVMNDWLEDPAGKAIRVTGQILGTCEDPFPVSEEDVPIPPFLGYEEYSFTIANPDPQRFFMYLARGVNPDGSTFGLPGAGDVGPVDFGGLEDAVIARGWLTSSSQYDAVLEPCPDTCWLATPEACPIYLNAGGNDVAQYIDSGIPVDLYGHSTINGLLGNECLGVTAVLPTMGPEGCGSVSVQTLRFGALKARYR